LKKILLTLIVLTFYSCRPKTTENKVVDNSVSGVHIKSEEETENVDEFCDTTKIRDFKRNLAIITRELTDNEKEYQLIKAKDFIKQSCNSDSLLCGEIKLKKSNTYKYDNEWQLFLTSYTLDQEPGMEQESASFVVLTIIRNNEPWFTDIIEDLIGEIQVELNGFEDKDRQVTVWGHAYPYFKPDYGKFRLIIKNGIRDYEFQCHSKH